MNANDKENEFDHDLIRCFDRSNGKMTTIEVKKRKKRKEEDSTKRRISPYIEIIQIIK